MRTRDTLLWLFGGLFDKLTRYMGACGFILYDSGGGGGGGNTTTTTSNIPDWLQDPTKRMVARGEALTGPDAVYQQYQGDRVAGFTPMQQQAFSGIAGLQAPTQFNDAQTALGGAQGIANAAALQGANYGPGQFQAAGYDAAQVAGVPQVGTRDFNSAAAQQYMSPYQQAVTDVAKRTAAQEGQLMQNQVAANAARNGAFGGSRFGLEQAKVYNDTGQRLSDIQVQGSQSAYDRAMQQFNTDQGRRLQADTTNAGSGLQALLANQAARNASYQFGGQNMMTAQQMAEQSRQFANDAGLRGADLAARTGLSAASQLGDLGTREQTSALERLNALTTAGNQQQALDQRYADTAYENFVNARDFDRNNLQFLSGLLRGNPVSTRQDTVVPQPSTASQLGGLGLAGLGAYKMFGS